MNTIWKVKSKKHQKYILVLLIYKNLCFHLERGNRTLLPGNVVLHHETHRVATFNMFLCCEAIGVVSMGPGQPIRGLNFGLPAPPTPTCCTLHCSVPLFVCTPAPRPAVCPEPLELISLLFSYCFTEFSSPGFRCAFSPPALRSLIRGIQVLGTISRRGSFCVCIFLFPVCGVFVPPPPQI